MGRSSRKLSDNTDTSCSSPSPSSSDVRRSRRRRSRNEEDTAHSDDNRRSSSTRRRSSSSSKRDKSKRREKRDRDRHGERKRRRESKRRSRTRRRRESETDEESGSGSSDEECSQPEMSRVQPQTVLKDLLEEFPGVAGDLKQLLQMIDGGQAVDIKGISEKALIKCLHKLFLSLDLEEHGDRVFLLRANGCPTLEVLGSILSPHLEGNHQVNDSHPVPPSSSDPGKASDEGRSSEFCLTDEAPGPRRRVIGPEMPSAELLAAAAKLTEAEAELREAELEEDGELFIGPPPPALVSEVASTNEAERFEEITRIMGAEAESVYDILGVNRNMSPENIKKRYWKLSLMVHPDKCSHPHAHQAFVKLNKAFKDLQDPDKRRALDDKIKKKEEEEEMKVELRSMREAALWRRSQGISMEGDDVLLAELDVKEPPKRDEWMTTLPPEKKPGAVPMQSTYFSKTVREGRGDTSAWTDTPSDKAEKARKAKMNYLEAYNEATALASNEESKKKVNTDAELVDQYNKTKRSKSLVQKHQEEAAERSRSKTKSKQPQKQLSEKEEKWVGQHPWKPWDREKDLTAGRQSVKLNAESLNQGLTSRFSSGNFQRDFL